MNPLPNPKRSASSSQQIWITSPIQKTTQDSRIQIGQAVQQLQQLQQLQQQLTVPAGPIVMSSGITDRGPIGSSSASRKRKIDSTNSTISTATYFTTSTENQQSTDQSNRSDLDSSSSSAGDGGSSTSSLPSLHSKISRPDLDQQPTTSHHHHQYLQHQALIGPTAETIFYYPLGVDNQGLSGGEAENRCWHNKGSIPSLDLPLQSDQDSLLAEDSRLLEDPELDSRGRPLSWRGFGDMHRVPAHHRYVVHISDTSLGHRGVPARSLTDLTAPSASGNPYPLVGGAGRPSPAAAAAAARGGTPAPGTSGWLSLGTRAQGSTGAASARWEPGRRRSEQLIRFDCELRDMWLDSAQNDKGSETEGGVTGGTEGVVNRTTRTGSSSIDKTLESLEAKGYSITETLGRGRFGLIVAAKSSTHGDRSVALKLVERPREALLQQQQLGQQQQQQLLQNGQMSQQLQKQQLQKQQQQLQQTREGSNWQASLISIEADDTKMINAQESVTISSNKAAATPTAAFSAAATIAAVKAGLRTSGVSLKPSVNSSTQSLSGASSERGVDERGKLSLNSSDNHPSAPLEAEMLGRLSHENVIRMYDYYVGCDGVYGLVLESCSQGSLRELLAQSPGNLFIENTCKRYFRDMLAAVSYIHSQLVAHRDMKCEHFLLDSYNRVKLTDFSAAYQLSSATESKYSSGSSISSGPPKKQLLDGTVGIVFGTPGYLPPEVLARRPYCPLAADVWALGVTLYVMLTSRLPYPRELVEALPAMRRGLHLPPNESVKLSKDVVLLIRGLLHSVVQARYTLNKVRCSTWLQTSGLPAKPQLGAFYRAGQFRKYRDSSPEQYAKQYLGI